MSSEAAPVRVEKSDDGQIWTVILDRKERRNAVDRVTADALADAFRSFDDDATARVAVLYGDNGIFCSGADLKGLKHPDTMNRMGPVGEVDGPMGPTRMKLSKPVIAAITGYAVAGGLELACWCDMRVIDEESVMGVFCRRWGVPLIDGGTVRLPRLIGESRAMDLILTGRPVDAAEAHAIGLANRVVPVGTVRAEAEALARQIAAFPQVCMQQDRLSMLEQAGCKTKEALENEFEHGLLSLTEMAAGVERFVQGEGRGPSSSKKISAVLFDLGGVLVNSPLQGIAEYERGLGLKHNTINRAIVASGPEGAFSRFERGELNVNEFSAVFTEEFKKLGIPSVTGKGFFAAMSEGLKPREHMLEAVKQIRKAGLKTGILTNNFQLDGMDLIPPELRSMMDTIVESSLEGLRKPDPRIYELAASRLGVPPKAIAYLDDIGGNLKPAAALGMTTIKVPLTGSVAALQKLQAHLPTVRLETAIQLGLRAVKSRL